MNRISELYESNHFLILVITTIAFSIYIKLLKKRNQNIEFSENENSRLEEVFIEKISTGSIVRLKYILTGEVVTLQISENQSLKYKNKSEIRRLHYKMPLAIALMEKSAGELIKFKLNETDENYIYVEILNVNNNLFTDEEIEEIKEIKENELIITKKIEDNIDNKMKSINQEKISKIKTNQSNKCDENLSYFKIAENWYGQKKVIIVTFCDGKNADRTFRYNHDEVYKNTINHYEKLDCWSDYSCFTNSRNIPSIAQKYVTEIF